MDGVGEDAEPGVVCGDVGGVAKDRVGDGAYGICDEYFFAEPECEPVHACGDILKREHTRDELLGDLVIPNDWPGDKLGEEGYIEREVERVFECLAVALGDVEDIRVGLKGEERNPDREHDRGPVHALVIYPGSDGVELIDEEVGVFEPAEDADVEDDGPADDVLEFFGLVCGLGLACKVPKHPVAHNRDKEPSDEPAAAPEIEEHARKEEHRVLSASRRDRVEQQHDREEYEQECLG